ncbi:tripartite tricarboxylate transporter substrate binding protein [Cryobacterium sp. TMT1-66-1]|uniref:tripartite tricarboxylate transporter substrate binding protein n=1 Tax=Cryobacterium sp. TMT1-66-1 TaxID=1259242 RepID=UPI00106B3A05|nr:tripartite tricarboxylate transporter substrate binding protein [Cryobacterium sp. TMT1-66-1]TFD02793.1 tripartite tricarboxylate transporter substrate binding protein [Cryobacterium sp. TMT1-66-1]
MHSMSKRYRRSLITAGAIMGVTLLAGCSSAAGAGNSGAPAGEAAAFPNGDIRFVIPYSAGGPTDVTARALAPCLGDTLGTNVIAENITGGSGSVGLQDMISKPADGQTLAIVSPGMVALSPIANGLDYSRDDVSSVGVISYSPMILIVGEDSPYSSGEEFFAAAEEAPATLTVGVSGASTPQAIELQRLADEYKVEVIVVPFDGSAGAITALLGGHVDSVFVNDQEDVVQRIDSGDFTALAVSSPERQAHLPETPTLVELGYDDLTLAVTIYALAAPAGMPDDDVATLSDALEECLTNPETVSAIGENYIPAEYQTGEEFDGFLVEAEKVYTRILGG